MLRFRDFVPRQLAGPSFFRAAEYESFEAAVAAADAWITGENVQVVQIETVVLPNIWSRFEEGSTDASLRVGDDHPGTWHQFVRVWHRA